MQIFVLFGLFKVVNDSHYWQFYYIRKEDYTILFIRYALGVLQYFGWRLMVRKSYTGQDITNSDIWSLLHNC